MTLSLQRKLFDASNASDGPGMPPPHFRQRLRIGVWGYLLLSLLAGAGALRAEGVRQLAPTADDNVMLLIGSPDFGNFAAYNGPENSRLYVQVREPGETVYLGLSARFNSSGLPQNTGSYFFRIRRASDGAVVHGPFPVSAASANVHSWADAANGPIALGGSGYATTDDRYRFEPSAAGLYFIEFSGVSYLGYWDIAVGKDGQARPGRVYSRNWAFRTPQVANVQPECVWDRTFNGVLYSYTSDGFVTRIDFANSGFQGLSFNVAFNRTGPGTSGDPALDRMSVANENLTSNSAEHLIFLTEPDSALFPDGVCGAVSAAPYFRCADGGYCLDVSVTQPGQVEVILDIDQDGQFDPGSERRLVKVFSPGSPLNDCLYWDGLLADGSSAPEDLSVNLIVAYTQGVQHWALYDGEYLKEGFCVEIIRPLCDVNATANRLYWDDRNITEQPGTNQPADGRTGCDCAADNCRTWNNFQSNNPDCGSINDNLTNGYGDKSTLNTWWFASIVNQTVANVPLRSATLSGPAGICTASEATLQLNWASTGQIQAIRWEGPQGVLATGGPELTSLTVTAAGEYRIIIADASGCEVVATYTLAALNCPADLSLDISASTAAPGVGEWVQFSILLSNDGPGAATQFAVSCLLPEGLVNPGGVSHGGVWAGGQLLWPGLQLAPGASLTLTFSALAEVALNPNWVVSAEITASAQPDPDSTPGNGQDTDGDGLCEDDPTDEDDADCVRLTLGACAIAVTTTISCDNNGTPTDPADDRFYAQLLPTAANGGSGWVAEGGVSAAGAYGQPITLGPFPIAQGPINLTVRDNFLGDACARAITLNPPATCSSECLITAQAGQIACDDAGTPSRAADDTYGFVLMVTGANVSGQWTTAGGLSGAYGQPVAVDAGLISGGNTILVIADAANPACGTILEVEAPPSCSDACEIEPALISNVACHDGGTPADPSDDTFTFDFRLTGYNLSGGWASGVGLSGAFNQTIALGPYPIAAGNVSFVAWDAANPECRVSVVVTPPTTCSNLCRIEASADNLACDDAGTPHDAADDTFTFDLLVSGLNNAGPAWTSPELGLGLFGQTQSMGPYAIAEGIQSFTFRSVSDAGCTFVLPVAPPSTCSDACLIRMDGNANTVGNVVCSDAGTPADPTDDTFTFDLRLTGYNLSGSWASSIGLTGAYDAPITLGPYPIAAGNVSLVVWDAANTECRASIVVTPPSTCSDQCRISATAAAIACDDAQTPYDPTDDTFTFDLLVSGLNNAGPAWASAELGLGFFGQATTAGPFAIVEGERVFAFRSASDEGCTVSLTVAPPPACSDACLLTITELEQICDDGQTPFEADDDVFYYRIRVAGLNTPGSAWQASDGSAGAYGETVVSAPQSLTGGERLVTLTDGQGGNCATEFVLTPPLPEVVCPPATDRMPHAMNLQLLRGNLELGDTRLPAAAQTTCWLGADWAGNLPPAYDALRLRVPAQTGNQIPVYHFFLFSNMPAPAGLAEYVAADGAGALFIGDSYYEPDPCCYLQSHPAGWASEGLVLANPYLDTAGLFVAPMHLVRRFSIRMTPGQVYTLMTTAWSDQSQGLYNWVILSEDELPPLELLSSNASSVVMPDARPMAFDLTYFDASWMLDNPVSVAALGEPAFDGYCGVDGWSFRDALSGNMGCDTVSLLRSFDIATVHGMETCEQEISLRHPVLEDIILPPRVALFTCGDDYEVNEAGYPDPGEAGYPLIITSGGVEVLETGPVFNLVVNYKDNETQDSTTTNVTREWTITNICGDTLMQFSQLIKIGAFDPPRLDCPLTNHYCPIVEEDIMLFNTDPFLCTATLEAPWPVLAGSCGEGLWTLVTEIIQVQGNDTLVLLTIGPGDSRLLNNWPLGDYLLRYTATDEGGNVLQRICRFRIADLQEPDPICRASLNAVLNGSGLNRLFVAQVDAGSYDNCGIATIELRRMFTRHPQTCDTLTASYWGDWGPYVQFSCCDAGLYVMVEMRVTDLYGNVNSCWTNVLVEDKTLPYCTGLANIAVSCDTLPALFNPYDTLQLQALFGVPQVIDNCAATAIELEPVVSPWECGPGQIIRRFRAVDRVGNVSAAIFQQVITISYTLNYALAFPADAQVDCTDGIPGVEVYYPGCDSITVEHRDVYLPVTGEECYYIERTYTVTNWCEWNGVNPAIQISRDEDCDGAQGEERVWAIRRPDGSFIDRDSLPQNSIPTAGVRGLACNPISNPQGHWRPAVSTGRWTYAQRIMVFDTVAPVVASGVYAPFCAIDNACEAAVFVPFVVGGECLPDTLSFRLLLDAGNDGDIDADLSSAGLISGVYPHYTIGGVFPIGVHRFELRVDDGCDNSTVISLPFEVADCYIPEPVCYSGLIANLEPVLPGVDADGDGDIDEAAAEVFAWQLASCNITDCSMPLRFSVNRPGETPDTSQTSVILTCEDRYRVALEVYMWDSAANPYAVQPNGAIGGPNYRRCEVEVLLRDTSLLCNDCVEQQLIIGGAVHTAGNKPIENVELRLTTPALTPPVVQLSSEAGRYLFEQLAYGGAYTLRPYKNDDTRRGITALDLLAIQRHLLGDHPLTNPYQLIAADVNNTRTVTTLDLVELRRLLLGDVETFANNTSWRFVRADYAFPEPGNPWAAVWPEQLQVTNLAACLFNQNFIGVKIGDINGSATALGGVAVETRSGREAWSLLLPDLDVKAGETYRVALDAPATEGLLAFQFGLDAAVGKAELTAALPGALPATHLGTTRLRQGQLTAVWDKYSAGALDQPLLTLEVRALANGRLSEMLAISAASLKAEAYRETGEVMDIRLNFRQSEANAVLALYPNQPNPFAERTLLSFSLPEAGKATLTVQDMTGAEVLRISEQAYAKGYNELWINRGKLSAGAYTFTLAYGNDRLSRRMVVVGQ